MLRCPNNLSKYGNRGTDFFTCQSDGQLLIFDMQIKRCCDNNQGPVVQSIVSLTSWLAVKMLTVLVSTISNSQVFLLKKCERLLQMQKLLTFFFSAKILACMPYLMIKVLMIR